MDIKQIHKELKIIDNKLADEDISIAARPIHAIMAFGTKFKISLPIVVSNHASSNTEYPKQNEYITNAIHEWYKNRYSELLKTDPSIGKTIVIIKGNPMLIKIPLIYGRAIIIWDINKSGITGSNKFNNKPSILNVIDIIDGLTDALASEVSKNESKHIIEWFRSSHQIYGFLKLKGNDELIAHAMTDLSDSVNHIVTHQPNYNQSRWSSLQACEKIIKAYSKSKGFNFKRVHNLKELAQGAGIKNSFTLKLLEDIQCAAGIRYGEVKTSKDEAVKAHQSMMIFTAMLIETWDNEV